MNSEQAQLDARIGHRIRVNGLESFRRQALKGLKLKTVIKESHCSQVQHLAYNLTDAELRTVFATVGKDQATIYDDCHMADHIGVVASFSVSDSIESAKDTFNTCCWINSTGLSTHPYGDALLAVAGLEPYIRIISVAEAAIRGQLPLPAGSTVVELSAAAEQPGVLLSLCKDGTMQLWHVATGMCCCSIKTDAFTAVLHPTGRYALTSNRSGKLAQWNLQSALSAALAAADPHSDNNRLAEALAALAAAGAAVSKAPLQIDVSALEGSVVDCMRFLAGGRLAAKTADGRMAVFSMAEGKALSTWKVPGCSSSTASYSSRCSFGHTQDGQYVCVGNHNATAYVFETNTGMRLGRVEAIRVQGSVRACGLSEDCRHLLMVVGSGYIFRFEYRPSADHADDAEEQSDSEGDEAQQCRSRSVSLQPELAAIQQLQEHKGMEQAAAGAAGSRHTGQQQTQQISSEGPVIFQQQSSVLPSQQGLLNTSDLAEILDPHTTDWMVDAGAPSTLATHGDTAEELLPPSLSAGMTASKPKRQRLSEAEGSRQLNHSPLVFRPTPIKP